VLRCAWFSNSASCIGQNLPCAAAASDASAALSACGCTPSSGKWRQTRRTFPRQCPRMSFTAGAACRQFGHSKSPYSTIVTGACSPPSRWSAAATGIASSNGWLIRPSLDLYALVCGHALHRRAPEHALLERGVVPELGHRQLAPHPPG